MAGPSKVTKNALPLHPALRFAPGSLTTPPLRGSPYKGHPWPFTGGRPVLSPHPCGSPLCATAPFTLLKGRLESSGRLCKMNRWTDLPGVQMFTWLQSSTFICAGSSLVLASRARTSLRHAQAGAWPPSSALLGFLCTRYQAMPFAPFRRPSGIVAEGSERHGCRERRKGPWMALVRRPPERRWNEGSRAQRDPDGRGKAFLLTFFATEKSESPSRAKQSSQAARKSATTKSR